MNTNIKEKTFMVQRNDICRKPGLLTSGCELCCFSRCFDLIDKTIFCVKTVTKILNGVFQNLNGVSVTRVITEQRVSKEIVVSLVTVALDLLADIVKQNHSRQVINELHKLLCVLIRTALSTIR